MKKRFSLLLAIVMVIAMVLPMLPMLSVPTVAAEESNAVIEVVVDGVSTKYTAADIVSKFGENSSNVTAIAAKTGKAYTVNILDDIEVVQSLWFYPGVDTTINGNGHKITAAEQSKWKKDGNGNYVANRIFGLQGNSVTGAKATITGLVVDNTTGRSCNVTQMYTMAEVNLGEGNHWIAREKVLWYTNQNITFNITGGYYEAGAEAFYTNTDSNVGTLNITDGIFVTRGTGNAIHTRSKMALNMTGGAVVGNINATGTSSITGGYCSGTVTGATPGANFVTGAVAGIGSQGYTTLDAALAAVKASATDATVVVAKDATIKAGVTFTTTKNITIKGYKDPTITIAKDDGTGVGNVFVLNGAGMTLTLDGVNLTGNAAGSNSASSCIFQIHSKAVNAVLNLKNVDMKDLTARWFIVNIMGNDGNTRTVNVENCTSTNIGVAMFRTGNPAGSAGADHCNHSVINITDSDLQCNSNVVSGSNGSTAAVVIKNSKLTSTGGHVVDLVAPTNLVANSDSAKIGITTCYYDEASVFTPKSGSKGINAPTSDKVVVGVIEATYQEGDGEVEYVSLQGALTKASSATKDVTINLYKDATLTHTSPIVMNGTGNVTVNGDLGNGSVAKITYTGKTNMIRWNATGKTLAFKNVEMDIDCSNACVFQLSHQTGGTTNLTLENVDMTAKIYWHIINSMVSDGGTPIVNIINSNLEVTAAGDPSTGSIVSTGNDNAHPQKLDLNVSGSTLKSDTIVISNGKSSVDANFVDSDLIATELDAIRVWGDVSGSKIVMDSASTITVPAGKKALAVTAPGATVNTPYDVVASVYVDGATTPTVDVLRKDFVTAFSNAGGGILETNEAIKGKNVVIELLADIDVASLGANGCLRLYTYSADQTVVFDGNGYGITAATTGSGPMFRAHGTGTVTFQDLTINNSNGPSLQYYNGVTVNINNCTWNNPGHHGIYPSNSGTLNINAGTTITAGSSAVYNANDGENVITIAKGATLISGKDSFSIVAGSKYTINIYGTVTSQTGNVINMTKGSTFNIYGTVNGPILTTAGTVNVHDGATVNGNITAAGTTAIDGTVTGNVTATGATTIGGTVNGNVTAAGATLSGTVNGDVTVTGDITVSGSLNGNLTVSAGKFTLDGGNIVGKLEMGEDATSELVNGTIVDGNITFVTENGATVGYVENEADDEIDLVGAEIRLRNDYTNGLRFVNTISKDFVNILKLMAKDGLVNYGTIILPKEYITTYSLSSITHLTLDGIDFVDIPASNGLTIDADGNIVISSALVEIKGSHYDWEFVSVVYASYTTADGATMYFYGDNTASKLEAKSVKSVAEAALADTQEEAGGDYRFPYNGAYTKYSPSKIKVLEAFTGIGEMPVAPEKPSTPPEVHKHTYTENVTAPTCFEPGYTTYTCACGFSYTGAETDPKHDAITHVAASAATCTENGNIEYWFCETCGDAWLDEECLRNTNLKAVVLPAGHVDANEDYKCDGCSTKMLPEADSYLTVKQAIAVAKAAGTSYTTDKYFVTGIVTNVYNTQYGNMYLKDDAGNELGVYGLYTWDKAVRYDAMPYKPVEGDELVIYTVLGTYNSNAQGKDAWMDDVVAHEHTANPATCTDASVCTICGATLAPANGHTFVDGTCACGATEDSAKTYSYKFTQSQYSANGTKTLNNVAWTLDGDGGYWGLDSNGKGQQFGSSKKPYKKMLLTSADFNDVSKIVINTSGASGINGTLVVTVGGVKVGEIKLTTTATAYTLTCDEPLDGPIVLTYTQSSSKALYILSIEVTYK